MTEFASWKAYDAFAAFVKNEARHFLDPERQSFVNAVLSTSEKRATSLDTGTLVWRSQLGYKGFLLESIEEDYGIETIRVPEPYERERMIPKADRASEGRVNPKGIPCLYFSTDDKTAVAESRPWVGAYVSVARFRILRD